ncbi:DUF4286 family protein [Amycolatopsis sp. GM8]|uniref:DUF4286 family protein n=1 Tax=Amycolatopsis sp. GM8 TaxID=2896530 RepID=UPI001F3E8929|nr:DUF4286 family protein [Amycolatopsis sp. GM8]
MPKAILVVMANSRPGSEEEFNRWYDEVHLADVRKIPGFVAARRFMASPHQLPGSEPPGYRYLTLWEIEADDLAEPLAAMADAVGTPDMPISDAMVLVGQGAARTVLFEPVAQPSAQVGER